MSYSVDIPTLQAVPAAIPSVRDFLLQYSREFARSPCLPEETIRSLSGAVESIVAHLVDILPGTLLNVRLVLNRVGIIAEISFQAPADSTLLPLLQYPAWSAVLVHRTESAHAHSEPCFPATLFRYTYENGRILLCLRQDRPYSSYAPRALEHRALVGQLRLASHLIPKHHSGPAPKLGRQIESALLLQACCAAHSLYPVAALPAVLRTPEKVVDLVMDGTLECIVAVDEESHAACDERACGLLLWKHTPDGNAVFFGPYIFTQERDAVSRSLLRELLSRAADSNVRAVFSEIATEDLVTDGLHRLAVLPVVLANNLYAEHVVWYRSVRTVADKTVFAQSNMVHFLEHAYELLELKREVLLVQGQNDCEAHSIFTVRLSKDTSTAIIFPTINGADMALNLRRHVQTLLAADFQNIFAYLDIGRTWCAARSDMLIACGFQARYILPDSGQGDILVWQYESFFD